MAAKKNAGKGNKPAARPGVVGDEEVPLQAVVRQDGLMLGIQAADKLGV